MDIQLSHLCRVTLALEVHKLGKKPTTSERLYVAEKRERLQARIDAFHRQAVEFWGPISGDVPVNHLEPIDDEDLVPSDVDDDGDEEENVFLTSPLDDDLAAERQALLLPSNLGLEVCEEQGYMAFVKQEKTLRMGQANDALQGIRLGLSRKAIIFRQDIRKATNKKKKLRSWDQIIQYFTLPHVS